MTEFNERRMHDRFDHITSKVMVKKDPEDAYTSATIINYSEGGMYLRTNEYMQIGQPVIIKMEESKKDTTGPEKYDSYNGKIRWIENIQLKADVSKYQYGIEYHQLISFF